MDLIERLRGILLPCDTCAGTGTVWAPTSGPDPDDLDLCHNCNGKGAVKHPITNEAADEIERLRRIIDSRPAINAGLPQTYIDWSRGIYQCDVLQAKGQTNG